ncbi:MAG TPA: hypothetical protein VL020_03725 [Pseudomonadales bacterium]|nr:hypothetical protein [Pseudomonadales bacterium]HUH57607.1 hypothetical protein [Pseudomonadales bacterium]
MFFCVEVVDNVCSSWAQAGDILTLEDALTVGAAFLSLSGLAWGLGLIAKLIINR